MPKVIVMGTDGKTTEFQMDLFLKTPAHVKKTLVAALIGEKKEEVKDGR